MSGHHSSVQVSVVIPVYNKWELTAQCLESLAQTLSGVNGEIIVVDNASSDQTAEACPALGEKLFGERFVYRRCDSNLNFGPASNLGARLGRGEYLLFLNNDTLNAPGYSNWIGPLLEDFSTFPNLAATGPILLYPASGPLGDTVQHLGVFVNPALKVGHLYEGIPAASPLAAKRRFFQIITAACMLTPKALFLEQGGFDERYINGFEDVDLCARLWSAGWRMSVNPEARLFHLTSQTPGRHKHERENSQLLRAASLHLLSPDWHIHLQNDGLELRLTEWQTLTPGLPPKQEKRLARLFRKDNPTRLVQMLCHNPLWHDGYARLAQQIMERGDASGAHSVLLTQSRLHPLPDSLFALLKSGIRLRDGKAADYALNNIFSYCSSFERYMHAAEDLRTWMRDIGLTGLAEQYGQWLAGADSFRRDCFLPFLEKLRQTTAGNEPSVLKDWAYTLWRELRDLPRRAAALPLVEKSCSALENAAGPRFSVLMPVYNPKPEHLREAVDSLLRQRWPHWELCMADDASPDPQIRPLLLELTALDPRIRVEFRPVNGHIAAATNTAIDMARFVYAALLDQDDLLTPDALEVMAHAIQKHPGAALLYSDEDKLFDDGTIADPYLKGHWDRELLSGQNMVSHLGVYRMDRLREIGGFRDGFSGSQDYDLVLRYTRDLPDEAVVRIPQVLYHWRAHAGSTASGVQAKSYALESAVRALQSHLDATAPGASAATVPGLTYLRAIYPLPQPRPLISLIIDLREALPGPHSVAQALTAQAGYAKYELLLLHEQGLEQNATTGRRAEVQSNARLIPLDAALSAAERLNEAAKLARGKILGFLGREASPTSVDWMREIVSRLCRPGVGAVGGLLFSGDATILHAGYLVDAHRRLTLSFHGLTAHKTSYFHWPRLARTVDALDALCLFTHADLFAAGNGFDATLPHSFAQDYCLRLREKGRRNVITPFAKFLLTMPPELPGIRDNYLDDQDFAERWKTRLEPCHPDLLAIPEGWSLAWAEGEEVKGAKGGFHQERSERL